MTKGKSILERFEAKVNRSDEGCWEWTGSRDPATGYGKLSVRKSDGKIQPDAAHRVSHQLYIGPIPEGLVIDHLCRNPGCVRPDHLEAVTQQTNFLRGEHRSAVAHRNGLCLRGHSLQPGVGCKQCPKARRGFVRPSVTDRLKRGAEAAPSGCRIWTGATLGDGYPAMRVERKTVVAYRVAFELANGPIPQGRRIVHACGIRACVEPTHLILAEAGPTSRR